MFWIGQKVVCVEDSNQDAWEEEHSVSRGSIYTIRGIETEDTYSDVGLYLEEIRNPSCFCQGKSGRIYYMERPFRGTRFRPAVEPGVETGMAILNKILEGVDVKQYEPA